MAAHAKSGRDYAAWGYRAMGALLALVVFAVGCIAGYQAKDSLGDSPFWLIYGGNTDPGDGQGNGAARDQMVAGGWTTYENSYQIQWQADLGNGNNNQVNEAMPQGHDAFNKFCGHGCIIAGFSWGTSPALQLAAETGTAPQNNYIFGAPQPSTGVWHSPYVDNPFIEPWIRFFPPDPDRFVPAGTQVFYDTKDPYANAAPSCGGPGLFVLNVQTGHYIISRAQANEHVWTGRDGAVMHEASYQAAPMGLPRSGSDPQQPWDFCPPNFPAFNIPAMNGDPGVPALPGIPSR